MNNPFTKLAKNLLIVKKTLIIFLSNAILFGYLIIVIQCKISLKLYIW